MINIQTLIVSAMEEELTPCKNALKDYKIKEIIHPHTKAYLATKPGSKILLLVSGIGMVSAASTLTWALTKYSPQNIINIGTAGGLSADSRVGQIVIGNTYINAGADATQFNYAPGQVPGQPPVFNANEHLLKLTEELENTTLRFGEMLSSDKFITENTVENLRETFPKALTGDMETQAFAQVAHSWKVPFIAIRGITDLCGLPDDQSVSFHKALAPVAEAVTEIMLQLLEKLPTQNDKVGKRKPNFDKLSLQMALYLAYAIKENLKPDYSTPNNKKEEILLYKIIDNIDPVIAREAIGYINAGKKHIKNNKNAHLSSKEYDTTRAKILKSIKMNTKRGEGVWPPTSQTIIKRFDNYWNNGLESVGIKPQKGRSPGGLKFNETDYINTLRKYLKYTKEKEINNSFANYCQWVKENQDCNYPSGATIRQHYTTWNNALNALNS